MITLKNYGVILQVWPIVLKTDKIDVILKIRGLIPVIW